MEQVSPFEQPPKVSPVPFSLEEKIKIQAKLMARYTGQTLDLAEMKRISQEGFTDELFYEFTEKYAKKFNELIVQEPELHKLYEENPEACIEYIHKRLGIESPTHH